MKTYVHWPTAKSGPANRPFRSSSSTRSEISAPRLTTQLSQLGSGVNPLWCARKRTAKAYSTCYSATFLSTCLTRPSSCRAMPASITCGSSWSPGAWWHGSATIIWTCQHYRKSESIPVVPVAATAQGRTAMTKADLIDEVSRLAELTRKDSEVIVETIFESVVRSLRAGDKIEIRGFGSFRTRQRKPRVGRNPKTGDRVEVPAKKIPFFKPSKELKDMVNDYVEPPAPAATPTSEPQA